MVHALEHGAVWIAYNPDKIKGEALDTLKAKVEGQPYMLMSPYPGLDKPISLQSWGHQLKLTKARRLAHRRLHQVAAGEPVPEPRAGRPL